MKKQAINLVKGSYTNTATGETKEYLYIVTDPNGERVKLLPSNDEAGQPLDVKGMIAKVKEAGAQWKTQIIFGESEVDALNADGKVILDEHGVAERTIIYWSRFSAMTYETIL